MSEEVSLNLTVEWWTPQQIRAAVERLRPKPLLDDDDNPVTLFGMRVMTTPLVPPGTFRLVHPEHERPF